MSKSNRMSFSQKEYDKMLRENKQLGVDSTINHFYDKPKEPKNSETNSCFVDGFLFDSLLEAKRYGVLKLWLKAGFITDFLTQHIDIGKPQEDRIFRYVLVDTYVNSKGKNVLPVYYIPDFKYKIKGILIVEDVKGYSRPLFINKKKAFEQRYPEINYFLNFDLQGWYPILEKERWEKLT